MKRAQIITSVILAVTAVGGLLTLLLPQRHVATFTPTGFRLSLLFTATVMLLQVGASALFLWGLGGFKRELRVAYVLICIGIILFGFAYLQTPILVYTDQANGFWVTSGVVAIPFVLPIILFYIGMRRFAKLFGLVTIWTSGWFALALSGVVTLIVTGLAFAVSPHHTQLLGSLVFVVLVSMLLIIVDVIILKIRRGASAIYSKPLGWFAAAMIVETVSGLIFVGLVLLGIEEKASATGFLDVPHVLGSFAFLWSGYSFKLINEDAEVPHVANSVSLIDIVVFAASQVSNPAQIDPLLDPLRSITSKQVINFKQGEPRALTPEQQAELRHVYSEIEQYLVTKEPLRQFTVEQIRHKVSLKFDLNDQEFQRLINTSATTAAVV